MLGLHEMVGRGLWAAAATASRKSEPCGGFKGLLRWGFREAPAERPDWSVSSIPCVWTKTNPVLATAPA